MSYAIVDISGKLYRSKDDGLETFRLESRDLKRSDEPDYYKKIYNPLSNLGPCVMQCAKRKRSDLRSAAAQVSKLRTFRQQNLSGLVH